KNDQVYLVSPEVAVAAALTGEITDPRKLGAYPEIELPEHFILNDALLLPPLPEEQAQKVEIIRGPNIVPLPQFDPLPEDLRCKVLLKVGDNITTDHIMPAGAKILPLRSNLPAISEYVFSAIDPEFAKKALATKEAGEWVAVVGGENYGQGSSREHAALAPRYLGVRLKLAKSFARIHKANLINFGILPVTFADPADYEKISQGDELFLPGIRKALESGAEEIEIEIVGKGTIRGRVDLTARDREIILAGTLLNLARE
ncbi:MAG: aconitate hydratase, partial [Thermodesulfobacteria bacterium]|nr:aconitate hydratase [Thermodesulfobacteriota bacterium]